MEKAEAPIKAARAAEAKAKGAALRAEARSVKQAGKGVVGWLMVLLLCDINLTEK